MAAADSLVLLLVALAIRLVSVAAAVGARSRPPLCRWAAFGGSALASAWSGGAALRALFAERPVRGVLGAHAASGFALEYSIDALSGWFLLVLAILGVAVAVYSIGYFAHASVPGRVAFVGIGFNVLMASVEWVFVAGGAIGFLLAWELMTLATTALVATEHRDAQARRAAFLYLAMSHVGTGCLLAGFMLLGSEAPSLAFSDIFGSHAGPGLRSAAFALFLGGFGVKAGVIPLHVWLPEAHPAAPSPISALMSGVLIKSGVYGILRFCAAGLGPPPMAWGGLVLALGAISMILGVLYALMQHDLKRLLAYHSIENVGIILVAAGAGMVAQSVGRPGLAVLALSASLLHVLNHALFKGLLFLGAGGVVAAVGTRQVEHMGGLARGMPWTTLFFLVGAMAISGLPFLNGFVSEWLVFQALLLGFHSSSETLVRLAFPTAGALLGLAAALAAACFVKAFGITFLALPRSAAAAAASERGLLMLAPQAGLALACVAVGLVPGPLVAVLTRVAGDLVGSPPGTGIHADAGRIAIAPAGFDGLSVPLAAVILGGSLGVAALAASLSRFRRRPAPAWGCGGELTAETEYTATAFSKPLMLIFSAVYRPTREVSTVGASPYYAQEIRFRSEVDPAFERLIYRPLGRGVLRLAERMRVIQAGSLHAYLGYVLALVLVLVLLVWWQG